MGAYLATGIVQKVSILKADTNKIPIENITKSLQKELCLEHYVFDENESEIIWIIKPEILEGNFAEFLEEQFEMYDNIERENVQQTISEIRGAETGEKIIELAESKSLINFHMLGDIFGFIKVMGQNNFSMNVEVNYRLMAFFMDGKIIMECYNNILHYFERNIRLQAEKYPVAGCVKTMITG